MNCRFWNALAWMFTGTVLLLSLFVGLELHCWSGLIAGAVGFTGGFLYRRYKRHTNSCEYLLKHK